MAHNECTQYGNLARKPVGELREQAHRQGVINVSRLPKDELLDILSW